MTDAPLEKKLQRPPRAAKPKKAKGTRKPRRSPGYKTMGSLDSALYK